MLKGEKGEYFARAKTDLHDLCLNVCVCVCVCVFACVFLADCS